MPASARSLRITESYRTRMIGLRNRAKAEAKRTWARVDPDALDATFNPGMLVLTTAQLQREAARLSAGYLAAYVSSEKGETVAPPMAMGLDVGKVWTGSSLTKAFRGAVIGTKIGIADGKEPIVAYKEGGRALVRTAGLAVDDVCRESLRVAMDQSPDVDGYMRAVKGTCEACLGAADGQPLEPGEVLDTHPNCQCVSEPRVQPPQPNKRGDSRAMTSDEHVSLEAYVSQEGEFDPSVLERLIAEKGGAAPEKVWRWMDADNLSVAQQEALRVGETFRNEGFVSTTSSRNVVGDLAEFSSLGEPVVFEIRGARGLNVERLYGGEQAEWLLQHRTDFKVLETKLEDFVWQGRSGPRTTRVRKITVEVVR